MKTKREFIRKKDGEEPGACGKVDMMVSSSDLGLSDSFVYPERYNAFQCKGNCDLKQPHKFINHSLMKALLNSKNKANTTDGIEACCVPIKFRSMSLLHLSEDDSIVLSTFNNMIVEECGCR